MMYVTSERGDAAAARRNPSVCEDSTSHHTRNPRWTTGAPLRTPSLCRILAANSVRSERPTTARSPVESSANSMPFAPASQQSELPDAWPPDQQQGAEFDPCGWAVHLKMSAKHGTRVSVALAEVKMELRAPTRSRRAKAARTAKKATAVVTGACA